MSKGSKRRETALESEVACFEALEPRLLLSALDPTCDAPSAGLRLETTGSAVPIGRAGGLLGPAVSPSTTPRAADLIGMDAFRSDERFVGIDGSGYAAVVIDTGINLSHPFFGADNDGDGVADRIVYDYDFFGPAFLHDSNASDGHGHGSNVASIIASSDPNYTGVAPDANIIAMKVFSDAGGPGNFSDVEEALQWTVQNAERYNIVSVNMSLGDDNNFRTDQARYGLAEELAALADLDVIVVAAAGNGYYEHDSEQGVSYPAADANALAVSAVYSHNAGGFTYSSGARAYSTRTDAVTPFSQRDSVQTDIFAPGAPITGADAFGSGTVTMHGTSQAAPHVAGAAVVMQQLAEQRMGRRLTLAEFTSIMRSTADTIKDGDDENDNVNNTGLEFPRLNLMAMAEAVYAMGNGDDDPDPGPDPDPEPRPGLIDVVAGLVFGRGNGINSLQVSPAPEAVGKSVGFHPTGFVFDVTDYRAGGGDAFDGEADKPTKHKLLDALASGDVDATGAAVSA